MAESLNIQIENGICDLELNRPDALNAINDLMLDELEALFDELAVREDVSVLLLRGAGRAFCVGLDIKQPRAGKGIAEGLKLQQRLSNLIIKMRRQLPPVIALLQGEACGGGFSLALAADIRLAAENARMNAAFIKVGLSGCDVGLSYLLPKAVGSSLASELMLTGRFLLAGQARDLGLVSRIVPQSELFSSGYALAEQMLSHAPLGLRLTKQVLVANLDAGSIENAVILEDRQQVLLSRTDDFQEALLAFRERRKADFKGT